MPSKWYLDHNLWLDLFILANLGCLAPDIYLAHSTNRFRHPGEYVPLAFSILSVPALLLTLLARARGWSSRLWRTLALVTGSISIIVGVVGLVWHLDSRFFTEMTLESLVYTAPFAAPLAYTGIGCLILMSWMVDSASLEWAQWVQFFALGGFAGNFIFSVADHAQNAFVHVTEWIPVASSAFAIGFLLAPFLVRVTRSFVVISALVMLSQVIIGLLGFYLHGRANLEGPAASMWQNFVHGAPVLAPLLFPNLTLLALIGLWRLWVLLGDPAPMVAAPLPAEGAIASA